MVDDRRGWNKAASVIVQECIITGKNKVLEPTTMNVIRGEKQIEKHGKIHTCMIGYEAKREWPNCLFGH
jgi:hypothetical protein